MDPIVVAAVVAWRVGGDLEEGRSRHTTQRQLPPRREVTSTMTVHYSPHRRFHRRTEARRSPPVPAEEQHLGTRFQTRSSGLQEQILSQN